MAVVHHVMMMMHVVMAHHHVVMMMVAHGLGRGRARRSQDGGGRQDSQDRLHRRLLPRRMR